MATIRRKRGKWQVIIRKRGHEPVYKVFDKKAVAERWARDTESKMERGEYLDARNADKFTLNELIKWFWENVGVNREKSSHSADSARLKTIKAGFGRRTPAKLTANEVFDFFKERLKVVSSDSVIKELSMLSDVLEAAREFRDVRMPGNVAKEARSRLRKLRLLKPGMRRKRRLRIDEQANEYKLIENCQHAQFTLINEAALFFVETGMRESELLRMTREDVWLDKSVLLIPKAKTDYKREDDVGRVIPLSPKAIEIYKRVCQRIDEEAPDHVRDKIGARVWPWTSRHSISQAFHRLCEKQGIKDLRIHDLRHEATSRMFELYGWSIEKVSAVTGHEDLRSLQRYTHPDPRRLAEDMARKVGKKVKQSEEEQGEVA